MSLALLAVLLLPVLQDDPQVAYREGLFEEVDQGNLDKAVELYAKVLKSGAPDALKAKALLRTGLCHEKKGKKKEAEQAWRDVVERFSRSDAAKIAQDRLTGPGDGTPVSIDVQVQSGILDLGLADEAQRVLAIRKLVLLGDAAMPDVTRALQHRDRALSLGAARVLVEQDKYEGVYDVYRRHFPWIPRVDSAALGTLLEKHPDSRKRFLQDSKLYFEGQLVGYLMPSLMSFKDPAFNKLIVDWFADPKLDDGSWYSAFGSWKWQASDEELASLLDQLGTADSIRNPKLPRMIQGLEPSKVGSATRQAALRALERHPEPGILFNEGGGAIYFFRIVDTEALFKGPVAQWLKKPEVDFRKKVLLSLFQAVNSKMMRDEEKARIHGFDLLASQEIPISVREAGFSGAPWGTTDYAKSMPQYLVLCRDYLRANPQAGSEKGSRVVDAIRTLLNYLPADSKDWPEVLDRAFDQFFDSIPFDGNRQEELKEVLVGAAMRAIGRNASGVRAAANILESWGTPMERVAIGRFLPGIKNARALEAALRTYFMGLWNLPKDRDGETWKAFHELYAKSPEALQVKLAEGLVSVDHFEANSFMLKSVSSSNPNLRRIAINHWRSREKPDSFTPLLQALKDPEPSNQAAAIEALGHLRVLDAVPELIKFLEGPDVGLRDNASAALKLIRDHFEERTKWQRWYDETKKALNK